jgi:hypothetical protein
MRRRFAAVLMFVSLAASAQCDDKQVVESFKENVNRYLEGYKANPRERVLHVSGGWVKEYYSSSIETAEIDVQKTSSLVSPYMGVLKVELVRHLTEFHKDRDGAINDNKFVKALPETHKHTYAYQDGKWIPKTRQHYVSILDKWFDCEGTGGCFEEPDAVSRGR